MPPKSSSSPFYGWTKVSSRGQVFISKNAMRDLNIKPGDILMVVRRKDAKGVTMVKVEAMDQVLKMIQDEKIPNKKGFRQTQAGERKKKRN